MNVKACSAVGFSYFFKNKKSQQAKAKQDALECHPTTFYCKCCNFSWLLLVRLCYHLLWTVFNIFLLSMMCAVLLGCWGACNRTKPWYQQTTCVQFILHGWFCFSKLFLLLFLMLTLLVLCLFVVVASILLLHLFYLY